MKSVIAYRNQMRGYADVLGTVKTVEKVAASRVHTLKIEVAAQKEYIQHIEQVLKRLMSFYSPRQNPFLTPAKTGKKVLLLCTSDKGLVGGLWHRSVSLFLSQHTNYDTCFGLGQKGIRYLSEEHITIETSLSKEWENGPRQTESIFSFIRDRYLDGTFKQVDILYPQFENLGNQKPIIATFLPFPFILQPTMGEGIPIFDPSAERVFNHLLSKYITAHFTQLMLETTLSELAARTISMEHASAKTSVLIASLRSASAKEKTRILTQKQLESFSAITR